MTSQDPDVTFDVPVEFDEAPTGRALEIQTDWRRILSVFEALGTGERQQLIRLAAAWAELDTEKRVLIIELAKHLRLAQY